MPRAIARRKGRGTGGRRGGGTGLPKRTETSRRKRSTLQTSTTAVEVKAWRGAGPLRTGSEFRLRQWRPCARQAATAGATGRPGRGARTPPEIRVTTRWGRFRMGAVRTAHAPRAQARQPVGINRCSPRQTRYRRVPARKLRAWETGVATEEPPVSVAARRALYPAERELLRGQQRVVRRLLAASAGQVRLRRACPCVRASPRQPSRWSR